MDKLKNSLENLIGTILIAGVVIAGFFSQIVGGGRHSSDNSSNDNYAAKEESQPSCGGPGIKCASGVKDEKNVSSLTNTNSNRTDLS